jgi:REP element-mobilizing transposase RayT
MNKSNQINTDRKSIRLKGYDYSQAGVYFVTLCAYQLKCLFGEIINGKMKLNTIGVIAHQEWFRTGKIRTGVQLFNDEFVIMPNHIHGIIWIIDERATR